VEAFDCDSLLRLNSLGEGGLSNRNVQKELAKIRLRKRCRRFTYIDLSDSLPSLDDLVQLGETGFGETGRFGCDALVVGEEMGKLFLGFLGR
jgi:hypothetical protein